MRQVQTLAESNARIAQLRAQGFRVKVINGPWGRIVLRSKKAFTCSAHHHCSWKPVKPLPYMPKRKPATKRKRRRATKRRATKRTKRRTKTTRR